MEIGNDIVALASAEGASAIALFRLSGAGVRTKMERVFKPRNKSPRFQWIPRKAMLGTLEYQHRILDEVLLIWYPAPHSYTGEDMIEISSHGSVYLQRSLLQCFYELEIAPADPGAFTLRAFLNQKLDLSQAEAVADLVAADSAAAYDQAMQQLRGGYSQHIEQLRLNLVDLASLLELELDFSEEDIRFADRGQLQELICQTKQELQQLLDGFYWGNAIKEGIPVVIAGKPNAGKSTLLNALLQDERAIVSPLAGTTRDTLEERFYWGGYTFRFIDTAGLRTATDEIEKLGIDRSYKAIEKALIVLFVWDAHAEPFDAKDIQSIQEKNPKAEIICIANKTDLSHHIVSKAIAISAQEHKGIEDIKNQLLQCTQKLQPTTAALVTQARHAEALKKAHKFIQNVEQALQTNVTADWLAFELKEALDALGAITGKVCSEDLLKNIFSKFCIGK